VQNAPHEAFHHVVFKRRNVYSAGVTRGVMPPKHCGEQQNHREEKATSNAESSAMELQVHRPSGDPG
jgi:hypothetical protein